MTTKKDESQAVAQAFSLCELNQSRAKLVHALPTLSSAVCAINKDLVI
jgi:hypothetical protein